jgi:excisionase family DNA binding protein
MRAARCGKRPVGAKPMKDQIIPPQLLLTAKQAAAALQLSERTLWELARRGEIKRLKINSSVRYDVKDLEAFIEAKKEGGAP